MKKPSKVSPLMGQKAYLKNGGCKCPLCQSKNIEAGTLEMDGASAWVKVDCIDCGAAWKDVYKLSGYTDLGVSVTVEPMQPFESFLR